MSILEPERLEGAKEALQTSRETFARRMYADGVALATISRYTELPLAELEGLLLSSPAQRALPESN